MDLVARYGGGPLRQAEYVSPLISAGANYLGSQLRSKAKNYKYSSGLDVPRFHQKFGMPLKRKGRNIPVSNKKRKVIQDEGGYTQFKAYRYKGGKRRKAASKRMSILNAIITRQRLRYSRINELSAGVGAQFLKHGVVDANFDDYPLFMFNLSNVRQGDTAFLSPFYQLQVVKPSNTCRWKAITALAPDGVTPVLDWQFEDNEGAGIQVGRKSFLDWARIRLNMWGKKNAPSKITVQIVQMPDEEYCPEFQNTSTDVTKDADFFWKAQVKPLINNPASGNILNVTKRMKVIRSWTFNFDPTSTTESDTDPHCKFFDFFYRIGRLHNYAVNNASVTTWQSVDAASAYEGRTTTAAGPLPSILNKSTYVLIKSMQQDKVDSPTSADTASFDFNFQVCHRTCQPSVN